MVLYSYPYLNIHRSCCFPSKQSSSHHRIHQRRGLVSITRRLKRRNSNPWTIKNSASDSQSQLSPPPQPPEGEQRKGSDLNMLFNRFWKVAAPYWFSDDKVQARLQLAGVFALTLATTGISVGFNFLGRDFYNALASLFSLSSCFILHFYWLFCRLSDFGFLFVICYHRYKDKDQEQFTKQLLYYLCGFAVGIPVSTFVFMNQKLFIL